MFTLKKTPVVELENVVFKVIFYGELFFYRKENTITKN